MPIETNKEYHVGISPSDVKWYALGRGWKAEKSRNPAVALYSSPDAKQQIQVPQKGDERDIALMMSEVLRKLSEIENRQIEDVSQDLRHPFTDALRLRVKSRLADTGTLPLIEGLKLFEGGRKLLISAACSTVAPQAFYPRKSLKQVEEFIKKCQVGQTAIGSYVASILCPRLAPTSATLLDDVHEPIPFERQVTEKLMVGLGVLSDSVQLGDATLIENGIVRGVSADLCDALTSITPPEDDSVLQIELSWSPVRPQLRNDIPKTMRFAAPDLAFIQSAGKKLLDKTVRKDSVEGRIVMLKERHTQLADIGRTVEIRALIDEKWSTVRFILKDEQYRIACDAYRDQEIVKISGLLRRGEQSKFYEFNDLESFEILPF